MRPSKEIANYYHGVNLRKPENTSPNKTLGFLKYQVGEWGVDVHIVNISPSTKKTLTFLN